MLGKRLGIPNKTGSKSNTNFPETRLQVELVAAVFPTKQVPEKASANEALRPETACGTDRVPDHVLSANILQLATFPFVCELYPSWVTELG